MTPRPVQGSLVSNLALTSSLKAERSAYQHHAVNSPSVSQRGAIEVLRAFDDYTVLGWLKGLPSPQPGNRNWQQLNGLSSEQSTAISILKELPNHVVLTWLHSARRFGTSNGSQSPYISAPIDAQRIGVGSVPSLSNGSTVSTWTASVSKSSAGSRGPPSPLTLPSSHGSCGQANLLTTTPSHFSIGSPGSRSSAPDKHAHGCPRCRKSKVIDTCDGWKRHMKEHEIIYPCRKCKLLDKDKIKNFSRKSNLIKHLREAHGIVDGNGNLASAWRQQITKKYFSCGFCVSLFTSMNEQLNHIDNEHFKRRKHIHAWDFNQVIRGLLLQPRVNSILRSMLGNDYTITQGFNWDPFANQHLQQRLEISEETPTALASAAINQGGHPSQQGPAEISSMTRYSGLQPQMAPQAPAIHYQNALTQPHPGADSFGADFRGPDPVDVPLEQQFGSAKQGQDWFRSDLSYSESPNPNTFSGTPYDAPMEGYQLPDQVVPPILPPGDASGWMPAPSISRFRTPPTLTRGYDGRDRGPNSSVPTEGWQTTASHVQSGSPSNLFVNPSAYQSYPQTNNPTYTGVFEAMSPGRIHRFSLSNPILESSNSNLD